MNTTIGFLLNHLRYDIQRGSEKADDDGDMDGEGGVFNGNVGVHGRQHFTSDVSEAGVIGE